LTNLDALIGISSIGGGLDIYVSLKEKLLDVGVIFAVCLCVQSNPALTNVDGLSGILSVGGDLSIEVSILCGGEVV